MIAKPYLIFVGDTPASNEVKTAQGLRDWAREDCLGVWRLSPQATDLDLPDMDPEAAVTAGARSLVLGIAAVGGALPADWIPSILLALDAGLDIVSGLHTRLRDVPAIAERAAHLGRTLHDVRHNDRSFPVATGKPRRGKRLLTVGTDCALGKKYTALAIARELRNQGVDADFRATGQTGIMISGAGVAIDSVVADFIAGAAEWLSPDSTDDHWDIIEGQGAILHPAYAGVTLGLLHGSQPDALILCHDPSRLDVSSFPGFRLRALSETMALYVSLARVTNASSQFVAISLNTSTMSDQDAKTYVAALEKEHGLACFDPMRFGIDSAVKRIMSL